MRKHRKLAEKIIEEVNKKDNDYEAIEVVESILNEHLKEDYVKEQIKESTCER